MCLTVSCFHYTRVLPFPTPPPPIQVVWYCIKPPQHIITSPPPMHPLMHPCTDPCTNPCTSQLAHQPQPQSRPHPTYTKWDYTILLFNILRRAQPWTVKQKKGKTVHLEEFAINLGWNQKFYKNLFWGGNFYSLNNQHFWRMSGRSLFKDRLAMFKNADGHSMKKIWA